MDSLNDCLQDPLAYAYQGDKRKNKSKSRQDASSIEEFVPALTSDDLSNVLKAVEISLENSWISTMNHKRSEQIETKKTISLDGLNPLKDMIVSAIMESDADKDNENWWVASFKNSKT